MTEARVELELLPGSYSVGRAEPGVALPKSLPSGGSSLLSVTRTAHELSIVALEEQLDELDAVEQRERGFRCLGVRGPLDFSLTGILASLAAPLAEAGISIFALSTFDTDYLLVRATDLDRALDALRAAGHDVTS